MKQDITKCSEGVKAMMKNFLKYFVIFGILVNLNAQANDNLVGKWKFILKMTHTQVPFIIEFTKNKNIVHATIVNGKERILIDEVTIKDNSVYIPLPNYEVALDLTMQGESAITGDYLRLNKSPVLKTPLYGVKNQPRFEKRSSAAGISLNGRWGIELVDQEGKKTDGVANFTQEGNRFHGSILTPTGDYRYLEGIVWGNNFEGASFDGMYNYTFRGTIEKNVLNAQILSNTLTEVTGKLNLKAKLPDAYKQTMLGELKFIFPNLKGEHVSLNHKKFKGKPVIVVIYGSWCPNCLDEMNYLIPWYKKNNKRGIEVIALAFERSLDEKAAKAQLKKVIDRNKIPYTVLLAGSTAQDKPAEKLKGLKNFISFPTTIFLNKGHQVVKVHAGFNGPSTGEFFETWKTEFNQTVDELLK